MRWILFVAVVLLTGCSEPERGFLTGDGGFEHYVKERD
jgi:hypothetical protein